MVRLTADLVLKAPSFLNPLLERELDLRGHKIPAIENLGVATEHDAIDFTDNDIGALANFPLMTRLSTLLMARNRVASISPRLGDSLPNLHTLVLHDNAVKELADLDGLSTCPKLTHLVLMGCPVTRKKHFRLWVIWRCPSVRIFDYQKVKDTERKEAKELFGTAEAPSPLAAEIINIKSKTFDVPSGVNGSASAHDRTGRIKLTDAERAKVQELIRNAKSMKEIEQLEKMLSEGKVPGGILDGT